MEQPDLPELMQRLISGLNGLQHDYEKLFRQHTSLESKLKASRDQYNELAKLLGESTHDTPPLSLTSSTPNNKNDDRPLSALEILHIRNETNTAEALRTAIDASVRFRQIRSHAASPAVKIWSGASADTNALSARLPSITESPMEQDFTVVGVPSKLGCPFASMAGKKLSSHAASVLSRYNSSHSQGDGQSVIRDSGSAAGSVLSRLNGRDSAQQSKSRRHSSLPDPIKAEICGLDSHDPDSQQTWHGPKPIEPNAMPNEEEPGVCPIRFLNQHSPEELAQYFEKHKHELPRSHEVCVRRYQSNEQQVRELDAKYSDVAQMIRGLGEKHQNYLPKDLEDDEIVQELNQSPDEALVDGRVERWANNLPNTAAAGDDEQGHAAVADDDEAREPRFSRSLREIRLGESPSRPWGISVPVQYLEKAQSSSSSEPVHIRSNVPLPAGHPGVGQAELSKGATCPFASMLKHDEGPETPRADAASQPPAADKPNILLRDETKAAHETQRTGTNQPVVFTGPIVVGYGPEEAARFLQSLAQAQKSDNE